MKKLIALALALFVSAPALAAGNDPIVYQRDPTDLYTFNYNVVQPGGNGFFIWNASSAQVQIVPLGTGLSFSGGTLLVTPGVYVSNSDTRLSDARTPLAHTHSQSEVTGLVAALANKFNAPGGSVSQYIRGDGSLATMPSAPAAFNFGMPSTRTLAVSTDYQASDPSKAAVITVSPTCTNATTVLAASACTLQYRMHTSTVTCSTGTVAGTWTSTYALGLLLTNSSGSPISINLPAGAHFILCPTAGTFTIAAVDQSAG